MKTGIREDPTKCGKGLHEWIEENIYTNPSSGIRTCKPCKVERRSSDAPTHARTSNHCRKGHEYTPENTRKSVRFIGGKKYIERHCIQCAKDRRKTSWSR